MCPTPNNKKEHQITTDEIKKAEQEEIEFRNQKRILENRIQSYNDSLKTKCILASLLIITAPFCYLYYKSNKQTVTQEMIHRLKTNIINENLQNKVNSYKKELTDYKQKSVQKNYLSEDTNNHFYNTAMKTYLENDFVNFKCSIIKAIDYRNDKAVLFLYDKYNNGRFGEVDEEIQKILINLLLYSSYIGNKQSTKQLADKLLKNNKNSKIGQLFLEKSKS